MKNKSKLTVNIPINFPNISVLVEGAKIKPDKIRVLLHQMYFVRLKQIGISNKQNNFLKWAYDEGYVPVHSAILKRLLTSNYKIYLKFLIDNKFLSVRESSSSKEAYSPGFSSKHYKLNPELFQLSGTPYHFRKEEITDKCIIKAVLKTKMQYLVKNSKNTQKKPFSALTKRLYKMEEKVKFDIIAAETWVCEQNSIISNDPNYSNAERIKLKRDLCDQLELVKLICDNGLQITIDKFGERLHTPLKRISRKLRSFMIVDGYKSNDLLCIDIANSQIYFLTLMMNKNIINRIIPEFSTIAQYLPDPEQNDLKEFIYHATNGTIYDVWKEKRKLEDREQAKAEMIMILFSKRTSRRPEIRAFKNTYPTVWLYLDKIKSLDEKSLEFIKGVYVNSNGQLEVDSYHKNVSCATQRLESRIFIQTICNTIIKEKLTPFFTIHDSIYFPAKNQIKIQNVITSEFKRLGVIPPKLKISSV